MKILSVSDKIIPALAERPQDFSLEGVELLLGCGDLPYYYQDNIAKKLRVPLYFVRGNHDSLIEYGVDGERTAPRNSIDLHRKTHVENGVILAGIEGCNRYNNHGNFQYTSSQMWGHVFHLVPKLLLNKLKYGRYLDILVTHAAPHGVHDAEDWTHIGIEAFNWLIKTFKPKYHFHGHNHVYTDDTITETQVGKTLVINTYGYKIRDLEL